MIKIRKALEDVGIKIKEIKRTTGVRIGFDKMLIEYKHFPFNKAKVVVNSSKKDLYEVITINWTFANNRKTDADYDPNKPSPNYAEVHKNTYHMTLSDIFKFKRNLSQVAEDIISIRPLNERKD